MKTVTCLINFNLLSMKNFLELSELIGCVIQEFIERFIIVEASQNFDVSKGNWKENDYFCFVDDADSNNQGSKWKFVENFV